MANIPEHVKKPQDRLVKESEPAKEVEGQTASQDVVPELIRVEYDGAEYVIDSDAVNDLETLEALENDLIATALRRILGDDQYELFKDNSRDAYGRVTLDVVTDFFNAVQATAASDD